MTRTNRSTHVRRARSLLGAGLLAFGLGVFSGGCGGEVIYLAVEGCTSDTQCKGARLCFEGRCVYPEEIGRDGGPPSDAGPDAGPDGGPDAGSDGGQDAGVPDGAVDGGGGGTGVIGDACMQTTDCAEGEPPICYSEADSFGTFIGGYCSAECSPDTPCPGDALCAILFGNPGACLKACQSADACRPEYRCSDMFGTPACIPASIAPP